jgi:GT2 family glycosyltransferase
VSCLESLSRLCEKPKFEVLAVFAASARLDVSLLEQVFNLRLLRSASGGGLLGACNVGADEALGDYLIFLTTGTVVKEDSVARLHQTFSDFFDAGLVGGKLISSNGLVLEAGGSLGRDGSPSSYGYGASPDIPELSYCREAGYCSVGLLMIPRALFQDLGYFDSSFPSGGYAEADLALRVRSAGKNVYCQATAEATCCDRTLGVTNTNTPYEQPNEIRARFYRRWKDLLPDHRPDSPPPQGDPLRTRRATP